MTARADSPAALVTGGTRGLGRALVLALARRGWRVYAVARSEEGLRALGGDASRESLDIVPLRADITRVDDNARLAARVAAGGRPLRLVIHNAGLLGPRVELAAYPPEEFRDVMAANVFAPFDLTRQLLPLLAPGAALEFVSSGASLGPRERWGAYNVSKIALDGLAGIWARELRPRGIRVYIIDPGPMRTSMRAAAYPDEDPATLDPPEARTGAFLWLAEHGTLAQSGERFDARAFRAGV
ncbi:MAG TPA: SDR family NAD(P)-dependent oxidoreductase [Gemmatimonadaceae bacterium]|nr:SDR family NAD(P)-dependent oxidoreductase [Gemmatimonadaceae bacterium]